MVVCQGWWRATSIRTIIVEMARRFARDLMVQEIGYERLRNPAVEGKDAKPDANHLIASDRPSAFLDDGPTSKLIRQVAEFDKTMTVAKLRGARAPAPRKRQMQGAHVACRETARGRRAQAKRLVDCLNGRDRPLN